LRELELAFSLDPLTQRSSAANDLSDFIDMERLSKGNWRPPITLPTIDLSQWPEPDSCRGGTLREDHPGLAGAGAHPDAVRDIDFRPRIPEYRRAIREFLADQQRLSVK